MPHHFIFKICAFFLTALVFMPSFAYGAEEQASKLLNPNFYPARVISGSQAGSHLISGLFQTHLVVFLLMLFAGVFAGFALVRQEWDERVEHGVFVLYFLSAIVLYIAQSSYGFVQSSILLSVIDFCFVLMIIAGLWTARYFLQLSNRSYLEQVMFLAMAGFTILGGCVAVITPQENILLRSLLFFVPAVVSMIVISVLSMFQRERLGRSVFFFAVGWIILSGGTIISALVQAHALPAWPLITHAFWLTLMVQAGFFISAMILRHRVYSNKAQQKRTRDIQNAMVKERLKKAKESVDQTRLIRVIEREREIMVELRQREMQRTEDMRAARDMADKSNAAKSAFLAVMSHEIRTPLNGIIGTMKLLQETSLSSNQKELVSAMYESSDSMISLLSDILDFEKIQQGRMDIENIDFDLLHLVQTLTIIMKSNASTKGLDLLVEVEADVPAYVRGDPLRLRQIITNLLSNAIKFTPAGHVKLIVQKGEDPVQVKSKPRSKIIFAVEDTGVGISKDDQKNLFKPFQQADKTIARKYGGTGLGLAISKKLVEGMGGNLNLESEEGKGTKFFFGLNMDHAEDAEALIRSKELKAQADKSGATGKTVMVGNISPMNILVVDDNALNRKVVSSFLQNDGHAVTLSESGEDAIKQCQLRAFDIIFLDIWMGGISGFETVKMIRALPNHDNNLTPIVAITGSATTDTVQRIEESGIEAYIEKPVNYEMLVELLHRFSAKKKEADQPIQNLQEGDLRKKIDGKAPIKSGPAIQNFVKLETSDSEQEITIETLPEDLFESSLVKSLNDTLSKEDLGALMREYMTKADEIINVLKEFDEHISAEDIFTRAHELKGMAANFGLKSVSHAAGKMENAAQEGDTVTALTFLAALEVANVKSNKIIKKLFG